MRRILSMLLGLVLGLILGLGPVMAAASSDAIHGPFNGPFNGWTGKADESQLPACCRRHGLHHCALAVQESLQDRATETAVSSSGSCPSWPRALSPAAFQFAAVLSFGNPIPFAVEAHAALHGVCGADFNERRSWPQRGPPSRETL